MSEPRLVSPMLDNFAMGGPISDHDGVRCCPAMRENSNEKYIVKIISVPASQTKLDALLLTGAYSDRNSALAYFHEQANGIVDEKKILDKLAQLEGFVAYEDCQVVPMDDGTGYDVYLLGKYRKTLARKSLQTPLTQLDAVNLGIDLCAALAICRRSGYMYVDLKPSNIYITGDTEYRIGDLGFVRLNSLKYESLPDKYRSCYTAPEVADAFASLSDKLDIYAAGMVLYQVYNEGVLPFEGATAPATEFDPPCCADEEMTQIILKACHPDPSQRWSDPVEMGQAIVSYMQKNGVNDTPLVAESFAADTQEFGESADADELEPVCAVEEADEAEKSEETPVNDIEDKSPEAEAEVLVSEDSNTEDPAPIVVSEPEDEAEPIISTPDVQQEEPQDTVPDTVDEEKTAESVEDEAYDNLSFLDDEGFAIDPDTLDYNEVSADVSDILSQIDDLTAHPVPDPVIAPDPIEIKLPEPVPAEPQDSEAAEVSENEDTVEEETEEDTDEVTVEETEDIPEEEKPYIPKKKRTGLVLIIVFLVLAALGVGGYFFYTEYYLQPIHSLTLTGSEDSLEVALTADLDEAYLSVACADSHGNKISAPVVGGIAVFDGLSPDTAYTITVEVDGFHELTGVTTKVYSTPIQTKIAQMNIVTGSESGSVILSFAVEGPDSSQWNVIYNAEDEAERITAFPSHMVTLTGLTVGKEYTFRIEPVDDIYLSGESEATYLVKNLICCENLRVVSCKDGVLTVEWDTPDGETVEEWSVRCYNEAGYDETLTTAENTVTFQNIDDTIANTVEVIANDMSVNQRILVNENSVTVSDFSIDNTADPAMLALTWSANREIPANGWTLRYSINGINAAEAMVVEENAASVPVVPNGNYEFTILDGAGNAVLGGPFTYSSGAAPSFEAYSVAKSDLTARLCKTPAASGWTYKDLKDEDYVNIFTVGEKISMVLALSGKTKSSSDQITIGFVITDDNDNLVNFSHSSETWKSMWNENYCELDIPGIPANAGIYTVTVYFNGAEAGSQKFEITP